MHNKFAVIDNKIVISGSYNWTTSADERNDENLLIIDNKEIIEKYQNQFNKLWESKVSIKRTQELISKAGLNLLFTQSTTSKPTIPNSTTLDSKVKIQVSLESVNLIYNNHVGNDWFIYSEVNGTPISKSQPFIQIYNKTEVQLKIYAIAQEHDKIPDIGSNTCYVNLDLQDEVKSKTEILDVIVTENRGRYSGNTAKWRFIYRVDIILSNK